MISSLKIISAAVILSFSLSPAWAQKNSQEGYCDGSVSCFNQAYNEATPVNLLQAPTFASLNREVRFNYGESRTSPSRGSYDSNRSSRRSRSGGFFSGWFSLSVPQVGPANSKGTVVVNPRKLTFAAYDARGDLVKSGRISAGMDWCSDVGRPCRTPVGKFRVFRIGSEDCISNTYPLDTGGGAPMPHCTFFTGGYALHGAYDVPNRNASHGCVRLRPRDAKWLYNNFTKMGTVVIVKPY